MTTSQLQGTSQRRTAELNHQYFRGVIGTWHIASSAGVNDNQASTTSRRSADFDLVWCRPWIALKTRGGQPARCDRIERPTEPAPRGWLPFQAELGGGPPARSHHLGRPNERAPRRWPPFQAELGDGPPARSHSIERGFCSRGESAFFGAEWSIGQGEASCAQSLGCLSPAGTKARHPVRRASLPRW
jgi:hypothetical protein